MFCIFTTQAAAQAALTDLEERAKQLWAQAGYSVDELGVIPKINGADAPEAGRLQKWDDVREFQEGFGFASPRVRYPNHADILLDGHTFEEKMATEIVAGD